MLKSARPLYHVWAERAPLSISEAQMSEISSPGTSRDEVQQASNPGYVRPTFDDLAQVPGAIPAPPHTTP